MGTVLRCGIWPQFYDLFGHQGWRTSTYYRPHPNLSHHTFTHCTLKDPRLSTKQPEHQSIHIPNLVYSISSPLGHQHSRMDGDKATWHSHTLSSIGWESHNLYWMYIATCPNYQTVNSRSCIHPSLQGAIQKREQQHLCAAPQAKQYCALWLYQERGGSLQALFHSKDLSTQIQSTLQMTCKG